MFHVLRLRLPTGRPRLNNMASPQTILHYSGPINIVRESRPGPRIQAVFLVSDGKDTT